MMAYPATSNTRKVVEQTMMRIGMNNETARWYTMVLGRESRGPPTAEENVVFRNQLTLHCDKSPYMLKCLEEDHRLEFFTLVKIKREVEEVFRQHDLYIQDGPVSGSGRPNNPDVVECANELRRITEELEQDVVRKNGQPLQDYRREAFQMMLDLMRRVLTYGKDRYQRIPFAQPGYIDTGSDLLTKLILSPRQIPGHDSRFVLPVLSALVDTDIDVVDDKLLELARVTLGELRLPCAASPEYLHAFRVITGTT